MSDAIDRAARAEAARKGRDEYWAGDPDVFAAGAEWAVAHLREAGLWAPAPLREEWGTRFGGYGYVVEGRTDAKYPFFWKGVPSPGVNVHRYRTDWLPADGISRAEGDGRADEREPTVPASQLRAFARLCVDGGDMTPAAARMLDRIIDGDGRADCHCAHCHQGPFAIMHICSDCGSKRCPRAAHHENRCAKASS